MSKANGYMGQCGSCIYLDLNKKSSVGYECTNPDIQHRKLGHIRYKASDACKGYKGENKKLVFTDAILKISASQLAKHDRELRQQALEEYEDRVIGWCTDHEEVLSVNRERKKYGLTSAAICAGLEIVKTEYLKEIENDERGSLDLLGK